MKTTLPCYAVRDLLPLYAEELTSKETGEAIRQHLDGCTECADVYGKMTGLEELKAEETAEVDYLKNLRRSRKRWILGAICAAVLICGGLTLFFALRAGKTNVKMDGNTLRISGTGDYAELKLPEEVERAANLDVQDDSFHLSAYLLMLQRAGEPMQTFLPGFLDRTDRSFTFIKTYLRENAPDCYPETLAEQFVDLRINTSAKYGYELQDEKIVVDTGVMFWHRDDLYVLALLNADSVEWQQIGYAFYLANCVDPYWETKFTWSEDVESVPYYAAYCKLGGTFDTTPENYTRLNHAIAYVCLQNGMGWDSAYSSEPVTHFAYYTGPQKELGGNALSPAMATSLIAWLTEQYGFEKVSAFCFGKCSFREAFGVSYREAYDAWSTWLVNAIE